MPDELRDTLRALIVRNLPGLCGEDSPPARVSVASAALKVDADVFENRFCGCLRFWRR